MMNVSRIKSNSTQSAWLVQGLGLVLVAAVSFSASAVRMDETTHDQIINRLEMGLEGMGKNEPERVGIVLRLADLYADRARLKSMNEMDAGCQKCTAGVADRERAINLYTPILNKIPKAKQGQYLLQLAHLYALNDKTTKAQDLYKQILSAPKSTYASEVRGLALINIAEAQFRNNEFKKSLKTFEQAQKENIRNSGLVEFRKAWCHFNLGNTAKATALLEALLQNPAMLSSQTTDGEKPDMTFLNNVSHDYAVFLSRGPVSQRHVQKMLALNGDPSAQKANLYTLGSECERLGKKNQAQLVWTIYVAEAQITNEEKLEVQARVAQIEYDLNHQSQAAEAYTKAISMWNQFGCSQQPNCGEIQSRLKKFVTAWNKAQKTKPSKSLLQVYQAYLSAFPNDTEMLHWAAIVAKDTNQPKEAARLFRLASASAIQDQKSNAKAKNLSNIIEGSLLGEIEMAEASKDARLKEQAYNNYLQQNPNGSQSFVVRYQRAQVYYHANRYQDAFSEFHYLASQPGVENKDLKLKAADLSLDSLAALKDHQSLQVRAIEYARFFPERKKEYLKISRTATLTLVASNLNNDQSASRSRYQTNLQALNQVQLDGADDKEKIQFFKNKLIVAQKAMDLVQVEDSANQLLKIKVLSHADREWTLEQQVWAAQLKMDFLTAYQISTKLKMSDVSTADRHLRLALLAELAGVSPKKHNQDFLKTARNTRSALLIRAGLVKESNKPWTELRKQMGHLKHAPDILAQVTLDAFSRDPNFKEMQSILNTTSIAHFPAGQTLRRQIELKNLNKFEHQLKTHQIYGYSDKVMNRTLKERLKLLNEAEKRAQKAVNSRDWTLQIAHMSLLARENRRLYRDIEDLPIPAKLNAQEKKQYRELLESQSRPYLARAEKVDHELESLWNQSQSAQNIQAAFMSATPELQKLYRNELMPLAINAPAGAKNRLLNLLNTPFRRPSQKDILFARKQLQMSPFDIGKAEALRDLERQNGASAMVVYLDERIAQLKKGSQL